MVTLIPTVKIQDENGGLIIINESDFDASKHTLFGEAKTPDAPADDAPNGGDPGGDNPDGNTPAGDQAANDGDASKKGGRKPKDEKKDSAGV